MTSTIRFSLALALVALAGCTRIVHEPVVLPLPARPVLPVVTPAEVQCLARGVYTRIVDRGRDYKTWGLQLEKIISTNNVKAHAHAQ